MQKGQTFEDFSDFESAITRFQNTENVQFNDQYSHGNIWENYAKLKEIYPLCAQGSFSGAISRYSRIFLVQIQITWKISEWEKKSHHEIWLTRTYFSSLTLADHYHTCHTSHCEIKFHRILPFWKPISRRFFKSHRILRWS